MDFDDVKSFFRRMFESYKESNSEAVQSQIDYDKTHPVDEADRENLDAHPGFSFNIFWHRF